MCKLKVTGDLSYLTFKLVFLLKKWAKRRCTKAKKKENPVLRARPTDRFFAHLQIFFFFFLHKKKYYKITHFFSIKKFSAKMRAKRSENFWIYERFLGHFSKKKFKKKNPPDRPTAFWNLFASRTGFFFFPWPKLYIFGILMTREIWVCFNFWPMWNSQCYWWSSWKCHNMWHIKNVT